MNIFINEINNIYYPLSYKLDNDRYFKYNSTITNVKTQQFKHIIYDLDEMWSGGMISDKA